MTKRSAGGQLALEATRVPWERCPCPKDSTPGVLPAVLALKGRGKSASTAHRAHQSCWEPLALSTLFAEAGWEGSLEDRLIPRQISSGHKLGENSFF